MFTVRIDFTVVHSHFLSCRAFIVLPYLILMYSVALQLFYFSAKLNIFFYCKIKNKFAEFVEKLFESDIPFEGRRYRGTFLSSSFQSNVPGTKSFASLARTSLGVVRLSRIL